MGDDHSVAPIEEKNKKLRKRKRKGAKTTAAVSSIEQNGVSMEGQERIKEADQEPPAKVSRQTVFEQRIRPPTLLERLLLMEIRKERNKILQCVRYVCKNNFFDDKKST